MICRHICRGQWFSNGNKRTAALAANHVLIHEGVDVFALPPDRTDGVFRDLLIDYYESDDPSRIAAWLKEVAVTRL